MNKKITISIAVIILVVFGVWWFMSAGKVVNPIDRSDPIYCGGNMANAPVCAAGYHCAPKPGSDLPMGDVGGICVED